MDDAKLVERAITWGEQCPSGLAVRVLVDEVKRLRALLPATPDPEPQPCPFCGGTAMIHGDGRYWVECQIDCNLEGPTCDTEPEAVAAWNRLRVEKE